MKETAKWMAGIRRDAWEKKKKSCWHVKESANGWAGKRHAGELTENEKNLLARGAKG
jgi:hypothetical protein